MIVIERPCWKCGNIYDLEYMTLMFATHPGQERRYICDTCRYPKRKNHDKS